MGGADGTNGDDALDAESVRAIVAHMNEDHADALDACVRAFADPSDAWAPTGRRVRMRGIDRRGFDVEHDDGDGPRTTRIEFPEPLASAADARRALVGLTRRARERLGEARRR